MTSQTLSSAEIEHVCTWWHAYSFDNPLRKLVHKPQRVLEDYVKDGMTVMDVGCGMGHFSIGMANMVGEQGKVIAVGPGKVNEKGERNPLDVKKGNRVLFGKYAGNEIKIDGVEHLIMREDDILGIVKE